MLVDIKLRGGVITRQIENGIEMCPCLWKDSLLIKKGKKVEEDELS